MQALLFGWEITQMGFYCYSLFNLNERLLSLKKKNYQSLYNLLLLKLTSFGGKTDLHPNSEHVLLMFSCA